MYFLLMITFVFSPVKNEISFKVAETHETKAACYESLNDYRVITNNLLLESKDSYMSQHAICVSEGAMGKPI